MQGRCNGSELSLEGISCLPLPLRFTDPRFRSGCMGNSDDVGEQHHAMVVDPNADDAYMNVEVGVSKAFTCLHKKAQATTTKTIQLKCTNGADDDDTFVWTANDATTDVCRKSRGERWLILDFFVLY